MEIKELKVITEEKQVTKSIVCNKCGYEEQLEHNGFISSFQKLYCDFGYGSVYDTESWKFEICESCLTDFVKTFKYAPLGFGEENLWGEKDGNQNDSQKYFEEWKINK